MSSEDALKDGQIIHLEAEVIVLRRQVNDMGRIIQKQRDRIVYLTERERALERQLKLLKSLE